MAIQTIEEADALIERKRAQRKMASPEQALISATNQPQPTPQQPPIQERVAEGVIGGLQRFADTTRTRASAAAGQPSALQVLGQREGVPFDVETGAGFMSRMAQELAFNRDEQAMLFKRMPNVQDVRFNVLGEPVLTVKDGTTGEVRDILANPVGIDPSDFAFVAANTPELVGGMLGAIGKRATKEAVTTIQKLGQWLISKDVVPSATRMAAAGQAAGTIKDVAGRGLNPALDVNAGEIAERRITSGAFDLLFGVAGGLAGKTTARALTPFSKRGPLQLDAEAAQEFWRSKGVEFSLTPAESSGAPFLARSEAFMTQKPGSSAVFLDMLEKRRQDVGKAQRIMLGTDPSNIPAADVIGGEASRAIQTQIAPLDFAISRETQNLLRTASNEILSGVSRAVGTPMALPESAVGMRLSERAFQRLEEFRTQSRDLYSRVHGHPAVAGQGRNIDVTPLAQDAQSILDNVASVERPVVQPTGLVDDAGRPITREATETQPLTGFVESGAITKLRQLAGSAGGKSSIRDLIELRRDIDDELFRGGALGGIPERRLSEIRDSITQRIEGGLQELDDTGDLLRTFQAANQHYADNIRRFKEVDIVEMFKGAQDRGVLGLNQTVTRAIQDPDRWRSYSDFFGANSQEMTLMRRAFADRVIGRIPGDDTIDANAFLSRLESAFQGNTSEIATDVFGQSASELRGLAKAMQAAGNKQVNVEDVANLIDQNSLTAEAFRNLVSAQEAKDQTLKNSILNRLHKGIEGVDSIKPTEFINKVVFKGEPSEITDAMARLADRPDIRDQLHGGTLMKIFSDASTDVAGKETINPIALERIVTENSKRLEPVLGVQTMEMLRETIKVLKPGAVNEQTFSAAGRLSAGGQVANIERHLTNPATMYGELSHIAKSFLLASLYKTGPIRNFIANSDFAASGKLVDKDAFINSFVIAEPIVEDMVRVFGEETSRLVASELKAAIDGSMKQNENVFQMPVNVDALLEQARQRKANQ